MRHSNDWLANMEKKLALQMSNDELILTITY